MSNDSFLINLSAHPNLLPIALEWESGLIQQLGYQGDSAYVMFWEDLETNTLRWFDGFTGSYEPLQAWWRWRQDKAIRMALRGINLQADFTEDAFGLLFDRVEGKAYVGRLNKLRELLGELAEQQQLGSGSQELLNEIMDDLETLGELSEPQIIRVLNVIDSGGVRPGRHRLH